MKLSRVGARNLWQLRSIERTPDGPAWIVEVEGFLLGPGVGSHLHEPRSAILIADSDGTTVGAALHRPDEAFPGAQYLSAMVIDHRMRGRGFGRALLVAAITDARERSARGYVRWSVHPDNTAMIALSRSIVADCAELGRHEATGYLIFLDP